MKKHGDEEPSPYPDKEQGIEKDKTSEEKKEEMEAGEAEEEPYDKEGREKLVEDNEMEDWEEGYSEGYDQAGEEDEEKED